MKDAALWDQLRSGHHPALEQIYRQHAEALFRYGCKFASDANMVEDCMHDLFMDLWNNRERLGPNTGIRPYLLVSLRRRIFKKVQTQHQRFSSNEPVEADFKAELAVDEGIISSETDQETAAKLQAAFQQLSARQREAVYLKFYQELEYQEICDIMGVSYQSARNLVSEALRSLRGLLAFFAGICFLFF